MKFIAKLRVWGNWGIGENVLKVFLRFRGSANRRVDLFLPLIASISGRRHGARGARRVASGRRRDGPRRKNWSGGKTATEARRRRSGEPTSERLFQADREDQRTVHVQ